MKTHFIKDKGCAHLRVCHDDLILEQKIEMLEQKQNSSLPSPFLPECWALAFYVYRNTKEQDREDLLPHEAYFSLKKKIQQTRWFY